MRPKRAGIDTRLALTAASILIVSLAGCNQGMRESSAAGEVADTSAGMPAGPGTSIASVPSGAATGAQQRALTLDQAEDSVEDALRKDVELRRFRLDADDEDGGIELEGAVETDAQRARADSVAVRAAPGFRIFNRIRVDPQAALRRAAEVAADEAEDRIEDAFKANDILRGFDLDVDDEDGRVILKGTVGTEADRRLAEEIAREHSRGVPVVNRIRVR